MNMQLGYAVIEWRTDCSAGHILFCKETFTWSSAVFDDPRNLHKAEKRHQNTIAYTLSLRDLTFSERIREFSTAWRNLLCNASVNNWPSYFFTSNAISAPPPTLCLSHAYLRSWILCFHFPLSKIRLRHYQLYLWQPIQRELSVDEATCQSLLFKYDFSICPEIGWLLVTTGHVLKVKHTVFGLHVAWSQNLTKPSLLRILLHNLVACSAWP